MSSFKIFDIAGSGMNAQNLRLNVVASNLANVDAVSSSLEDTYRARQPVFQTIMDQQANNPAAASVRVSQIVESQVPPTRVFQPAHPQADEDLGTFRVVADNHAADPTRPGR